MRVFKNVSKEKLSIPYQNESGGSSTIAVHPGEKFPFGDSDSRAISRLRAAHQLELISEESHMDMAEKIEEAVKQFAGFPPKIDKAIKKLEKAIKDLESKTAMIDDRIEKLDQRIQAISTPTSSKKKSTSTKKKSTSTKKKSTSTKKKSTSSKKTEDK